MHSLNTSTHVGVQVDDDKSRPISAIDFLKSLFAHTIEPIYICSFPNGRDDDQQPGERHVATRTPRDINSFVANWDKQGRGLYFCIGTVKAGRKRNKANVVETIGLHADIDFKNLEGDSDRDEAVRKLSMLMYPPTIIVFSGGGLHCYWLFKEALPTQGNIDRIEAALRQVADVVAGDPSVCEVARVLRLPGSHNTKNGKWVEVEVLRFDGRCRYELDDLEEWLAESQPILARKPHERPAPAPADECDPFSEYARAYGMSRVNVDERLENMTYKGANGSSIHETQLACSAAMLNGGMAIDDVVAILLSHTERAAGAIGARWNWGREERALRYMCYDWLKKHPRGGAARECMEARS